MPQNQPGKTPNKPERKGNEDDLIHYNANVRKYVESGKVERSAEKAREAIDDPKKRAELEKAERAGKKAPSKS